VSSDVVRSHHVTRHKTADNFTAILDDFRHRLFRAPHPVARFEVPTGMFLKIKVFGVVAPVLMYFCSRGPAVRC
jgi:hypothetical protein